MPSPSAGGAAAACVTAAEGAATESAPTETASSSATARDYDHRGQGRYVEGFGIDIIAAAAGVFVHAVTFAQCCRLAKYARTCEMRGAGMAVGADTVACRGGDIFLDVAFAAVGA